MNTRGRSIWGALLFFGGLLLLTGAGVHKSSVRIDFQRSVERHHADPAQPPSMAVQNVLIVIGILLSVGGAGLVAWAIRDMVAEIGSASVLAEQRLQRELMNPKGPAPKPPT
jgi:hypothetical protein